MADCAGQTVVRQKSISIERTSRRADEKLTSHVHDVGGVDEGRERWGAQEAQKRPNGVDDTGSYPTGRLRTGRSAIPPSCFSAFAQIQTAHPKIAGSYPG